MKSGSQIYWQALVTIMRHVVNYFENKLAISRIAGICLVLAVIISLVSLPAGCKPNAPFPTDSPAKTREAVLELELDLLGTIHRLQLDEEGRLIDGVKVCEGKIPSPEEVRKWVEERR